MDIAVAFKDLSDYTAGILVYISGNILWCLMLAVISMFGCLPSYCVFKPFALITEVLLCGIGASLSKSIHQSQSLKATKLKERISV